MADSAFAAFTAPYASHSYCYFARLYQIKTRVSVSHHGSIYKRLTLLGSFNLVDHCGQTYIVAARLLLSVHLLLLQVAGKHKLVLWKLLGWLMMLS